MNHPIIQISNKSLNKIRELNKQERELRERDRQLRREIIESECPIHEGDTIKINGYSYENRDMQVTDISFVYYGKEDSPYRFEETIEIRVVGKVLKKDGTPGEMQATSTFIVLGK